jgi:hypothetical protein
MLKGWNQVDPYLKYLKDRWPTEYTRPEWVSTITLPHGGPTEIDEWNMYKKYMLNRLRYSSKVQRGVLSLPK